MNNNVFHFVKIVAGCALVLPIYSFALSQNAKKQLSDDQLIVLAKQKKDKIKLMDYIDFYEKFLKSAQKPVVQFGVKWSEENKEEYRKLHNSRYDYAQKYSESKKRELFGDPNMSRKAWEEKFDKEWNPKKEMEESYQRTIQGFKRDRGELLKELKTKGKETIDVLTMIESALDKGIEGKPIPPMFRKGDPRYVLYRQQLQQWLKKY